MKGSEGKIQNFSYRGSKKGRPKTKLYDLPFTSAVHPSSHTHLNTSYFFIMWGISVVGYHFCL